MKMTGARIVIECLVERGVDTVFGYPGGTVLNIYDELFKNADRIRHILTSHEQGAAHAADGYARATGRPGVVIATSGPGATNLVTGIATAYMDSSPLIAITGNVSSQLLGKDSFQEIDIAGVTMPITKHNFIVKHVELLAPTLRKAFAIAVSGRPGPVLVDITKDVTALEAEWAPETAEEAETLMRGCMAKCPDLAGGTELDEAARLITAARRPFLYAGGGVIAAGASEQLRELAERLHAPVALSLMGQGALGSTHPLFTGMIGMHGTVASNMAASRADLIIAVGARFSDRVVGDTVGFAKRATVLHIDIDPAEINKNVPSRAFLVGDLRTSLAGLLERIPGRGASEWNGDIEAWKREHPVAHDALSTPPGFIHPRRIIEAVHDRVGDNTVVTTEVGQHQMWVAQFYPFSKPRSFISSGGLGTMGFGTGASIGVQVALPDRRVVHFAGDGSFRMNLTELATISHYRLPILIMVMNNGTLGMVRQWQRLFYGNRFAQTTLDRPPDFVKLADAYGIPGWRASDEAALGSALDAALASGGPALIDCRIDIDEAVLPMVPSGRPMEEQILESRA